MTHKPGYKTTVKITATRTIYGHPKYKKNIIISPPRLIIGGQQEVVSTQSDITMDNTEVTMKGMFKS